MKIIPPKITAQLESKRFSDIFYEEDPILEMCTVSGSEFMDSFLERPRFYHMEFDHCLFTNTDFSQLEVVDVRFKNCDFSNADLSKASIHRAEFINCKLLGTSLPESAIHHVTFQDCILNLATFGFSKLENIHFVHSQLQGTDFYQCKFKHLAFDTCDLNEANFEQTPLNGVDLSTSYFETLTVSMDDLKGCQVSTYQALRFSTLMGLIIKE